jgi:hypothetical protein
MAVVETGIIAFHVTKHGIELLAGAAGLAALAGAGAYGAIHGYRKAEKRKKISVARSGVYVILSCGLVVLTVPASSLKAYLPRISPRR